MSNTYTVNVSWGMFGHIDIEADSIEEAIEQVENDTLRQLSEFESDYDSGSFAVDHDSTHDQNEEH